MFEGSVQLPKGTDTEPRSQASGFVKGAGLPQASRVSEPTARIACCFLFRLIYGGVGYQNCCNSCGWGVRGEGWITLGSVDKALEHRAVGSLPGCRLIDGHLLASGN